MNEFGEEPRLPSIPDLRSADLEQVVAALKEWVEVRQGVRGEQIDRAITMRDLLNAGLATPSAINGLLGNGEQLAEPPGPRNDADTPPAPEKLEAAGALKNIVLTWQFAPGYTRLAYFEVWRAETDALGSAIMLAHTYAPMYADEVGPGKKYFYWVRAVSDIGNTSNFNSFSGTAGETSIDPAHVLAVLEGRITASQLYKDLGDRIDKIDTPVVGLVDKLASETGARIAAIAAEAQARTNAVLAEAQARAAAITTVQQEVQSANQSMAQTKTELTAAIAANAAAVVQEVTARTDAVSSVTSAVTILAAKVDQNTAAITSEQSARVAADASTAEQLTQLTTDFKDGDVATLAQSRAYVQSYSYSKSAADSAIASANTAIRAEFQGADAATLTSAKSYVQDFAYSKAQADSAIAARETAITTAYKAYTDQAKADAVAASSADVRTYSYSKSASDYAMASQYNTITSNYQSADAGVLASAQAYVTSYAYSKSAADQAIATQVSQVTARLDNVGGASIEQKFSAQASVNEGLRAQYTIKMEVGGIAAGIGLASSGPSSAPEFDFAVRANTFYVAPPNSTTKVPPFIYRSTGVTINGEYAPPGLYLTDAFISNGTITNAKIGNLAVDDAKIANLSVSKLTAGALAVGQYVQSTNYSSGVYGFRIHGNGSAEFNDVSVRGTVEATSGHVGNIIITAQGIKSVNYDVSNGFFLSADGGAVFGRGVLIMGTLVGADGTFKGQLQAASGTFTGQLQAAGGTFAGQLQAAGGTFAGALTADAINAVSTVNIAGASITGVVTAEAGSATVPSGGDVWAVGAALAMPAGSSGAVISATVNMSAAVGASVFLRIARSNLSTGEVVQIKTLGVSLQAGYASTFSITAFDPMPVAGTGQYWLVLANATSGPGSNVQATAHSSSIVVQGAKR